MWIVELFAPDASTIAEPAQNHITRESDFFRGVLAEIHCKHYVSTSVLHPVGGLTSAPFFASSDLANEKAEALPPADTLGTPVLALLVQDIQLSFRLLYSSTWQHCSYKPL